MKDIKSLFIMWDFNTIKIVFISYHLPPTTYVVIRLSLHIFPVELYQLTWESASAYTRTTSSVPEGRTNARESLYFFTRLLIASCSPGGVTVCLSASVVLITCLSATYAKAFHISYYISLPFRSLKLFTIIPTKGLWPFHFNNSRATFQFIIPQIQHRGEVPY